MGCCTRSWIAFWAVVESHGVVSLLPTLREKAAKGRGTRNPLLANVLSPLGRLDSDFSTLGLAASSTYNPTKNSG